MKFDVLAGKGSLPGFSWQVPVDTPIVNKQRLLSAIIISIERVKLMFIQSYAFAKDVNTGKKWSFGLGLDSGIDVSICVFTRIQLGNLLHLQTEKIGLFYKPTVQSV